MVGRLVLVMAMVTAVVEVITAGRVVGSGSEDVWVHGHVGGEVVLGCEEEVLHSSCPSTCLWEGPGGVFCSSEGEGCTQGGMAITYTTTSSCSCSLHITTAGEEHAGDWLCVLSRGNTTKLEEEEEMVVVGTVVSLAGGNSKLLVQLAVLAVGTMAATLAIFTGTLLLRAACARWACSTSKHVYKQTP